MEHPNLKGTGLGTSHRPGRIRQQDHSQPSLGPRRARTAGPSQLRESLCLRLLPVIPNACWSQGGLLSQTR